MRAPADERFRKRIPCAFNAGGRSRSGLVLNVSRSGLFLQTSMPEGSGTVVDLELNPLERAKPIALTARVVWRRAVPAQLRTIVNGGFGMQIIRADEAYYGLLSALVERRGTTPDGRRPAERGKDP
ncbi:MAG: PilZ domain-containing protein [Deltaproteobacteria bacterium]|nr:MAG: PilZ domain-containing protein [Deltaproteobacteria bacterium]